MAITIPTSLTLREVLAAEGNAPWIGIDNRVTFSNVTADSEDALYPAVHLANLSTDRSQRWQAADTDSCVILVSTSDSPHEIDYVGIVGHNLSSAQITIMIEVYVVDDWVEVISERYLGADEPHIFRFDQGSYTDVRVTLGGGGSSPASIGVLQIGSLTVVPTRVYVGHTPMRFGRSTDTVSSRNQTGQFLGRVVTGERFSTSVDFKNLPPSWVRSVFFDVIVLMQSRPFLFAWRPLDYPDEVAYAWVPSGSDPRPVNQRANGMMSVKISMEGVV